MSLANDHLVQVESFCVADDLAESFDADQGGAEFCHRPPAFSGVK